MLSRDAGVKAINVEEDCPKFSKCSRRLPCVDGSLEVLATTAPPPPKVMFVNKSGEEEEDVLSA